MDIRLSRRGSESKDSEIEDRAPSWGGMVDDGCVIFECRARSALADIVPLDPTIMRFCAADYSVEREVCCGLSRENHD